MTYRQLIDKCRKQAQAAAAKLNLDVYDDLEELPVVLDDSARGGLSGSKSRLET